MEDELLWKLEGLHTVETVAKELNIEKQSAINLLSMLKKEGHVTTSGGGRQKRLYKITMRKQLPRNIGMFDLINKYSPMKIAPWYDHQVHGRYTVEDALVDAIETQHFRVILASMHLFYHITNWPRLYKRAKEEDSWQKVGALYDVARMFMKVRRMPEKYRKEKRWKIRFLIGKYKTKEKQFIKIWKLWRVHIPFRIGDIEKTITR